MYDGIKICLDVKVGEAMEDGFKTGRVTIFTALRANRRATRISDMDTSKGKAKEVCMVKTTHMQSASKNKYQNHNFDQNKFLLQNFRKAPKVFTPLRESQTQLYEKVESNGYALSYRRKTSQSFGKIL